MWVVFPDEKYVSLRLPIIFSTISLENLWVRKHSAVDEIFEIRKKLITHSNLIG